MGYNKDKKYLENIVSYDDFVLGLLNISDGNEIHIFKPSKDFDFSFKIFRIISSLVVRRHFKVGINYILFLPFLIPVTTNISQGYTIVSVKQQLLVAL
jgi:hypothetical protein